MRKYALGVAIVCIAFGLPALGQYVQTNLVSDGNVPAEHTDANLVNSWGLLHAFDAFWVADNGTAVSTVYDADGNALPHNNPLVINIPPAGSAAPDGIALNRSFGFRIQGPHFPVPALFLFASEDGTVAAWNPVLGTDAVVAITSDPNTTVYKGIALGGFFRPRLFVANFRSGMVEMYDSQFHFVRAFTDPDLPAGYAPFGIRNINGLLVVTFAVQDAAKHDDVKGAGHGLVDIFDTDGHFVRRLVSHGDLNSPWGLALAPRRGFGPASGKLLVGNFGDGVINIYDPNSGAHVGALEDPNQMPITIDGLWGLEFARVRGGGDVNSGQINFAERDDGSDSTMTDAEDDGGLALFFAAGPNDENDGLFGRLDFQHGGAATGN